MVKLPEPLVGPEGYVPAWDDINYVGPHALHYDRDGQPITLRQWTTGYEDASYRILGHDTVGDVCVVTIWNGLGSFTFGDENRNLIFSSTYCRNHEGGGDAVYFDEIEMATEEEALAAHARRVQELKRASEQE